MGGSTTHRDVAAISLELLLLAREVARVSLAEAHVRFGLDRKEAEALRDADVEGLRALASQGRMLFRPRFTANELEACAK